MIRVLIVDDSPFIRLALRKLLSSDEEIKVVGEASNGREAVELVKSVRPDVITLDINMPVMDGLTALEEIRRTCPECKVLMISALTKEGAKETIEALNRGAFDFITKPAEYRELLSFKDEIIGKVKAAYQTRERRKFHPRERAGGPVRTEGFDLPPVVSIGVSTGGPQTLGAILPKLPKTFPSPILIAIHMPDTFTSAFARHLDSICQLKVKEAQEGETVRGGCVYVSKGRIHMTLRGNPQNAFIEYVQDNRFIYKPSADLLLSSSAEVYGRNTVGVVLTGMGNDGSQGIVSVKRAGGVTVAEDPSTAVLWAMPENAIKTGCVDYVVSKEKLPDLLVDLVSRVRSQR